mgnify:CR=1 FL=1
MQWPPLTSRIDLCQRLTVLQDSCKMHLCSRFFFVNAIFHFVYIFSFDIKYNIIIWIEILFEIGNICRDYIVVYLF